MEADEADKDDRSVDEENGTGTGGDEYVQEGGEDGGDAHWCGEPPGYLAG